MERLTTASFTRFFFLSISFYFISFLSAKAFADPPVRLAVATNFKHTLEALVHAFETEQNIADRFTISAGASGVLANQIKRGAPFQIFFSADSQKVEWLEAQGIGIDSGVYAIGRLALVSLAGFSPDTNLKAYLEKLSTTQNKLAIANAKLAPYGVAAQNVLNNMGLKAQLNEQLVLANNVSQVMQFVHTNAVAAGFVSYSQVDDTLPFLLVNEQLHDAIIQQYTLIDNFDSPSQKSLAFAFTQFVLGDEGRQIIAKNGYALPSVENVGVNLNN